MSEVVFERERGREREREREGEGDEMRVGVSGWWGRRRKPRLIVTLELLLPDLQSFQFLLVHQNGRLVLLQG